MNENLAYKDEPYREPWREELIAGKLVAMAPASMFHIFITSNIYFVFATYLRDKSCTPIADGAAVYLTDNHRFIPDFMIVCDPNKIRPNGVHGTPDLVVEVLSPSTARRDRGQKKEIYERCGVKEYWLVNPRDKSVEQNILTDGRYQIRGIYTLYTNKEIEEMTLEDSAAVITEFQCSLYDDLIIRLEDIFRRVP